MKVNKLKLSLGVLTVLTTPIAVNIAVSSDVLAAQGWVKAGNTWSFYNNNGTLARNTWVGNYWLGADGKMVTNAWVDNGRYYVDGNGAWIKDAKKPGWKQEGTVWYYLDEKGNPVKNKWIGNYWLGADGKMVTNAWVDNGRYYVDGNGAWVKDAKKSETKKQGWKQEGTVWYYLDEKGVPVKNKWVGNYWLGTDGKMVTNAWVDNGRYYVDGNGAWVKDAKKPETKKQGWKQDGAVWYYLDEKGVPVKNKWIGNYWLGADGKMATNAWVDNKYYYVGKDGAWIKDAKKSSWLKEGTVWYYLDDEGTPVKNKWIGNYWLGADGKMAINAWVDNNQYYVGRDGKWLSSVSKDKNSKRLIFLDPGHGGSDPGAVGNGVREKDLTLSIYNKVSKKLSDLGFSLLTSRNVDKDVGLVERAEQANNVSADMLLSIHFNSGGRGVARGIETYYYQAQADRIPQINKDNHNNAERLDKSRRLAQRVQQNLLYQTGAMDRGVKRASFVVLRETSIPSILVELGFIDNPWEVSKIKTNEYQEKLADGIVDGIVEYYK